MKVPDLVRLTAVAALQLTACQNRQVDACVDDFACVGVNVTREEAQQWCSESDVSGTFSARCIDCILSTSCVDYHCVDAGVVGYPGFVDCSGQLPGCEGCGPLR